MGSFLLLLLVSLWLALAQAKLNSTTVSDLKYEGGSGEIRFHFDDSVQNGCKTVIMMGVGTAMSVGNYDKVANKIVRNSSIVFIMTDHNPPFSSWLPAPIKMCQGEKYARLAELISERLSNLIHVCRETENSPRYFIGGHSASGQSAVGALKYFKSHFYPYGFIGLDPYDRLPEFIPIQPCPFDFSTEYKSLPVTLNIGFERETCGVDPTKSAARAYEESNATSRVLMKIKNPASTSINHCSFTDNGCGYLVCGPWNETQSALVRQAVAKTFHVLAAATGGAVPADYKAIAVEGLEFHLAVNNDDPDLVSLEYSAGSVS
jgi:hypothetical protein